MAEGKTDPNRPLEDRLRGAGERIEEELRRAVRYLEDEVVPEVRRNSSAGLRALSERLGRMAEQLDDERRRGGGAS